jgi:aspartate racemase
MVVPASRARVVDIVRRAAQSGADGVILGCTEIAMLIGQGDVGLPVFDTTRLHAEAAMDYALGHDQEQ